jgi:hypothetical protein
LLSERIQGRFGGRPFPYNKVRGVLSNSIKEIPIVLICLAREETTNMKDLMLFDIKDIRVLSEV